MLKLAKELLSHTMPGASNGEIYNYLAKNYVEKNHPKIKAERAYDRTQSNQVMNVRAMHNNKARYIPAKESHAVWRAYDGNGCSYVDPKTNKRCSSTHRLERDHIKAFALGGESTSDNIILLCRNHNIFKAESEFGKFSNSIQFNSG